MTTMATQATQHIPNHGALHNGPSASEKLKTRQAMTFAQQLWERVQAIGTKFARPWRKFQSHREEQKRIRKPPEKEVPFTLSFRGLLLLLVFEILILVAITSLWLLTTSRNGFVDAPDTPTSFTGSQTLHEKLLWGFSLLWTFIPSLVVSLCGALFAATLQALQDYQPTIELRKTISDPAKEASKAKLSILLDYRRDWFPFADSYHALLNKHFLISACTIAKWFFVAAGPLASAIISIGNVPKSNSIQVTINKGLNDSSNESWWSSTRPSFDTASAILLNNASTLPWSTKIYSVVPFSPQSEIAGNLTADTTTYSATLDCVSIDVDSLLAAGNVTKDYQGIISFAFVDRGCEMVPWIVPSSNISTYSSTSYFDCPYEAIGARLVLVTGTYDSSSNLFSNFSIISCLPSFWRSRSRVSALWGADSLREPGHVIDIVPDVSTVERWWPKFWQAWMTRIPEYQVSDPQNLVVGDNFGFMTYSYAMKQNVTAKFVLAMNETFSVLFATFATTIYTPLAENVTLTGTVSRPGNRLFVVSAPASLIIFVIALSFVTTIWIAVYSHTHKLDIKEHVDLIFGHAILLNGNHEVGSFINLVKAGFERQARVAIAAANAKNARKIRSSGNQAVDPQVDTAVRNGDFVRYAEDFGNFKDWDCWVERNGTLHMKAPQSAGNSSNIA